MTFTYNHFKQLLGSGDVDFETATFKMVPLQVAANTTADTEDDVTSVGGFTTLGEHSDASYTSGGITLTSTTWTKNVTDNRSEFSSAAVQFAAISGNDIGAVLLIMFDTDLSTSIPVAYIDSVDSGPNFPLSPNGGDINLTAPADGWFQIG